MLEPLRLFFSPHVLDPNDRHLECQLSCGGIVFHTTTRFPPLLKKKKIFPLVRSFFLLFNCLGSTTCSRTLLPGTSPHLYPRVRCSFGPSVLFECGHVCSDSPTPRLHLLFFQLNPKGRTEERTKTRAQNYEIGSWVKASRRHHSLFNRMVDALFFIIFTAPRPSWPPVPDCMEQRGNRRSGVNGPIHLSLEKEEEESRCSKDRVTLDLLLSFVVDMITVIKFFSPTADRVWNNAGGRNLLINGNCAILIFF